MANDYFRNLCIFNTLDGLRDGLSHFSGTSRAALIYALKPDGPIRIYDPQNLLRDHEPKFKELYLDSDDWRKNTPNTEKLALFGHIHPEKNLQLAGLISSGGRSRSVFYQMWFTEHHPDMCSIGPTERWLEHATWLLSHDFAAESTLYTDTSGYVLREYSTHAVRDYILDEMNVMLGWDTQLRIYPLLDAVLGISKTREEGAWPRGELVFVEPKALPYIDFLTRFTALEQPGLKNFKHVRKLLLAVEHSDRKLVSDGQSILGIATGDLPENRVVADFRGTHGFLRQNANLVCSFSDASFHSSTFKANLVQLEEALLESKIDPSSVHMLFKMVSEVVHSAERQKYGCTIVIDLNDPPIEISGQNLEASLDLNQLHLLDLAKSLAKVDGALHIGADLRLHRFACLLDGCAVPSEDRARGARFNSALRFTAAHNKLVVIVVSADRPVSVIQEGVELNAQCEWKPLSTCVVSPPTLQEWLNESG